MAPPTKKAAKKSTSQKKDKVFHPQSRKADQLVRKQLRKGRLADLARARSKKHGHDANLFGFFYHAMPPEGGLTLEELHSLVRDVWLTRFDSDLEEERAARRKGRPKSTKEQHLESLKERETEEYRTGMEIIDLTDPQNVELFRRWDQKEVAYMQQLRMIRISSASPETAVVSRPGKHPLLTKRSQDAQQPEETVEEMELDDGDGDEAPLLLEPAS